MQLKVDFTALEAIASRFRSDRKFEVDIESGNAWEPIDVQLQSGIEVSIEQVVVVDNLLSYQGRHVILYIRDHGRGVVRALEHPASGRKYHLADCTTLQEMRADGRFDRYVVTQSISGEFDISGFDPATRREIQGKARLQVCMNCLRLLNYKSYLLAAPQDRGKIRDRFALLEFFETYSTRFKHLPSGLSDKAGASVYSEDWAEISQRLRAETGFTCESCSVCLEGNRSLLHVHHVNGVKSDNRRANLQVLCKDCHRKQPNHQHIFMRLAEMNLINELRRRQGRVQRSWTDAKRYADLAVRPLLEVAERVGWSAPEIGLEDKNATQGPFDAAWPEERLAVSSVHDPKKVPGWKVTRPGSLLSELAKKLPPGR
jgi:Restriction endonuclease